MVRYAMNLAAGGAAFLLAAWIIQCFAPLPDVPQLRQKWEYFSSRKDSFDALVIGSSRIRRGISPAVFDESLVRAGFPCRSFNFGIDGMFPPESFFLVRKVLREKPAHLKWVFLEIVDLETVSPAKVSLREIYWRDSSALQTIFRKIGQDMVETKKKKRWKLLPEKLEAAWNSTRLFLYRQSNVGVAADFWRVWQRREEAFPEAILGESRDGFLPFSSESVNAQDYQQDYEEFLSLQSKRRATVDAVNRECFSQIARETRATGAELILVVTPTTIRHFDARKDAPPNEVLFAFDDPVAYPELYELDARSNSDHLSRTGAERLTRVLAGRFADYLKNQK